MGQASQKYLLLGYLVGLYSVVESAGGSPKRPHPVMQGDNFSILEGRVFECRSFDRTSLQWVECGVAEKGNDWLVF